MIFDRLELQKIFGSIIILPGTGIRVYEHV